MSSIEWLKRWPVAHPAYRLARAVRLGIGSRLPPRAIEGIPGRVHRNDLMAGAGRESAAAHYAATGQAAAAVILGSVARAGKPVGDIESWLDFGCGHGRVMRFLAEVVDPRRIWAFDVDPEAAAFCANEFGVNRVERADDLEALEAQGFDVIYAISVLTHLPEDHGRSLLEFFGRALNPGGIAVFTTHGPERVEHATDYGRWIAASVDRVRRDVVETGFGYVPYPYYSGDGYGLAWHNPDYVRTVLSELHGHRISVLDHQRAGLDNHQDVFTIQRLPG